MLQTLLMGLVELVLVISLTILLIHFGARDRGEATAKKITSSHRQPLDGCFRPHWSIRPIGSRRHQNRSEPFASPSG